MKNSLAASKGWVLEPGAIQKTNSFISTGETEKDYLFLQFYITNPVTNIASYGQTYIN